MAVPETPFRSHVRSVAALLFTVTLILVNAGTAGAEEPVSDPHVAAYQQVLADHGFYRGDIDGLAGPQTRASILAFHKAVGAERSTEWDEADWFRAATYDARARLREDEPNRVEVDLTAQIATVIRDGEVAAVLGVSSGNGETYAHPNGGWGRATTPRGSYTFNRHINGPRYAPLGLLYKPWYFKGGFAIHGSNSVPAWPASHGCVRVTNWDADWLAGQLELGMAVHLYDGGERHDPATARGRTLLVGEREATMHWVFPDQVAVR